MTSEDICYRHDAIQALAHDHAIDGPILRCSTIMIECTYLEQSLSVEAERRGHITWHGLRPHAAARRCHAEHVGADPLQPALLG